MKTMFKKTLVAAAVIGLSANAFAAVNVVTGSTAVMYSTQTLDGIATTFTVPRENFAVTLGAEYAVGDVITFTFSNDALASSQLKSTITTSDTLNANGTPAANVAGAQVTLGLLSTTATSATYRVTEVSTAATTVGQKFTIANGATLALTASKVKAGNGFKITYAAQTSNGIVIDASSTQSAFQLVWTTDQFAIEADPVFDAVVDVALDRKKFEGSVTTDAATFTITNKTAHDPDGASGALAAINLTSPVAFDAATLVIKGDFSWVKDTSSSTAGIQADAATLAIPAGQCLAGAVAGNSAEVTWAADKVTIECDTNAGDAVTNAIAVTFDTAQGTQTDPVIPATAFTYDATIEYATTKSASYASGLTAGAWTLNGSSVFVPYMVYGTLSGVDFSQVINVANNSSKAGDIKVDVWNEDGTVLLSNVKVGDATANDVTSVAGAIRTALSGVGFTNGKVSMKVTTNVPANLVEVYSAYTDVASRERAIVNNTSN